MNKRIAKWLSWLLVFAMVMVNMPVDKVVWGIDDTGNSNEVRVVVINNTYSKADGANWEGTLLDTKVKLKDTSNAITVVEEAVKSAGYTITGAESNYITEIGGLSAYDGGNMSGWQGTVNDWFTNEGLNAYSVSNGKLEAGDEICMWYSCSWGTDVGSDWSSSCTSLKSIAFSAGTLSTSFDSKVTEYTLVIPDDVTEVMVTPTAENKNFMVKTYKNIYTPSKEGSEYKRSASIPVVSGDKIIVGVGNTAWPSMNSGQTETVYTFNIRYQSETVTKPIFQQFNIMSGYVNGWVTNETYNPDVLEYNIDIKNYGTSSVIIQSNTKYDTDKYVAVAKYIDSNGQSRNIVINSGKMTTLSDMKFGYNNVEIVISDITDTSNSTTYTLNITRPYDTSIGLSTSKGLVVLPEGRKLFNTSYMGYSEGTIFKLDENGEISAPGMSASCYNYKTFVLDGLNSFRIVLKGKTNYVRIRISEDGENYTEVLNGSSSPLYSFGTSKDKKLYIQTISDSEYLENGFANVSESGNEYTLNVVQADVDTSKADIISAECKGDWYPGFDKDTYSYGVVIGNSDELPVLTFKAAEGAKVTMGTTELTPDENGNYSITLKTSLQKINIESESGVSNTYSFKAVKKSKNDVPDKVVDYLCINSQYTNLSYGIEPMMTLSGSLKSLGNFGGYITYYYEEAITDNPNNMYGVDFYVYGNSFSQGGSAAETGQVWVSEDGNKWYALAGSEHYEDTTLKDYEITYTKTDSGKTAWTDNYGGSNDGTSKSGLWVDSSIYYLNDLADNDTITLKGILIPSLGGSLYGDGSTASYVGQTKFGYVDYNPNGKTGANVNPYDEDAGSNGFDLKWAVDEDGNPVVLENGIHYIKVVTASNIWAGGFGEKSTEVSSVVRTSATETSVGVTQAPESIIVTNGNDEETIVKPKDGVLLYNVKTDDSKTVRVSVKGTHENDNIYINNTRVSGNESVDIAVSEQGKKVRIILQNGEKEPVIYVLNIVSENIEKIQNIYDETTEYLLNQEISSQGYNVSDWVILSLARGGRISDELRLKHFKSAYESVKSSGSAKLHNTKSTDNSKMILTLTSLGYDVTDVAGENIITPLYDYDYVMKQGNNGPIWALIALDSADYEIPQSGEETQTTRENLIQAILDSQLENGGFSLDNENADVDITAMALQALSPYYNSKKIDFGTDVYNAVENALAYLSLVQEDTGGYGSYGTQNCESTAQVIVALTSLGINPRTDSRFIKSGTSVLSALSSYYLGNGQFAHTLKGESNGMSVEQAYLALVAYNRFINSQTSLYNMIDVAIGENPVIKEESSNNNNISNNNNSNNNSSNNNNLNNNTSSDKLDEKITNGNGKKDNSIPDTGDNHHVFVCVLLMSCSSILAYTSIRRRKKNHI